MQIHTVAFHIRIDWPVRLWSEVQVLRYATLYAIQFDNERLEQKVPHLFDELWLTPDNSESEGFLQS